MVVNGIDFSVRPQTNADQLEGGYPGDLIPPLVTNSVLPSFPRADSLDDSEDLEAKTQAQALKV